MSEKSYSRDYLQSLANQPIRDSSRASKLWLPEGRSKAPPLPDHEKAANRANASARRALDRASTSNKRAQLLEYYAGTSLPPERVAEHIGISVDEAAKALKALRSKSA